MAYTLQDLQTTLIDDLKDPNFNTTRLARYINYGQLAIFNTHMFKFTEKSVSQTLTVGSFTVLPQTDMQTMIGGVLIDPSNTTFRIVLNKDNYLLHREYFEQYPDPTIYANAAPSVWSEFSGNLYFDRKLDKAYTFVQRYYKVPTTLVAAGDVPSVPESFREILEYYARSRAEEYRGNADIAAVYMQKFEDGLENMVLRYSVTPQAGPATMGSARQAVHN